MFVIKSLINLPGLWVLFLCHFVRELFISIFSLGLVSQSLPAQIVKTTMEPPKSKIVSHIDDTKETNYVHHVNTLHALSTRSSSSSLSLSLSVSVKTSTAFYFRFKREMCLSSKVQIFYQNVNLLKFRI